MIALVQALRGDAAVAALVGERIYPQVMPDTPVTPALVYTVVSFRPANSLGGDTAGAAQCIVQVDAYAKAYGEVQALADAVHSLLGTARQVPGLHGYLTDRSDDYEDDTQLHRVSMDFNLWKEGTP